MLLDYYSERRCPGTWRAATYPSLRVFVHASRSSRAEHAYVVMLRPKLLGNRNGLLNEGVGTIDQMTSRLAS